MEKILLAVSAISVLTFYIFRSERLARARRRLCMLGDLTCMGGTCCWPFP